MAKRLGISSSYLTLMERNQRAVTARVIVQLAEEFGYDPRDLREDEAIGGIDGLARRLNDERFNDLGIDRDEVVEFLTNAPQAAAAFARLFDEQGAGDPHSDDPLAACRREIDRWRNHFADLDVAAEQLADELRLSRQDFLAAATDRLREKHHLAIRILPREVMPDAIRRLDFHARQVQLSEMLSPASRNFELALQIAELEQGPAIASIAAGSELTDHAARKLFERHLSEYFAAALMMPYGRFLRACDATAYDLEVLTRRFGASVELVAQRLTTLHRVGQRGLPFFMARFDRAGQFSKRIAGATGTTLIEGEHSCPLWQVHYTFGRREGWLVQPVMLEESAGGPSHWLTMSYAVASAEGASSGQFAIVLGIEARLAADLVMAQGVSLQPEDATRIGLGCARCYWRDCRQRSLPPKGAALNFELIARANLPYSFS